MNIFTRPPYFSAKDHEASRQRPLSQIKGVILHITGYGPGVEALDRGVLTESQKTESYARRLSRQLIYKCHWLVGRDGSIVPIVEPTFTAHHTGSEFRKTYAKSNWLSTPNKAKGKVSEDWWKSLGLGESPLNIPVWEGGSPNKASLGIDILSIPPNESYSSAQLQGVIDCLVEIGKKLRFQDRPARTWVWTHSEVCPLSRTTAKGQPWDPGKNFDLDFVLRTVDERLRAQVNS